MLREARRRKEEQELEGSPYKETWATRTLLTRTRAPQNVDVLGESRTRYLKSSFPVLK